MKSKLFSNGLTVVSLITSGMPLTTDAKSQAHGHQHDDVFGRIMHKSAASSGSSLNVTTLGTAHSKTLYSTRAGIAVLADSLDSVAVFPTATGVPSGTDCFHGSCDPKNAMYHSNPFTHATPVPQLQLHALEAQDGPLASLPSRRRNRYRAWQTSGKDEATPITELDPASTGTMLAKSSGTCSLTYWSLRS